MDEGVWKIEAEEVRLFKSIIKKLTNQEIPKVAKQ